MKLGLTLCFLAAQTLFAAQAEQKEFGAATKNGQNKSLTDIPFAAKSNAELIESKAEFLKRHGSAALWLEDAAEADKVRQMLRFNPTDADLNYIYGAYLMRQGRKVDAMIYLMNAAEGDTTMVLYQVEAGRALVAMQGYAGALKYFDRANNLSFEDIHRLNELGDTYVKAGKPAAAKKVYSESLRIHANQPAIAQKVKDLPG